MPLEGSRLDVPPYADVRIAATGILWVPSLIIAMRAGRAFESEPAVP